MIKLFLCIVVIFVSSYIGVMISKRYKLREILFFDFVTFCNNYEANLEFFQKDLNVFVMEFCKTSSKEFSNIMTERGMGEYYDKNSNIKFMEKFNNSISITTEEQSKYINNFLNILGKSDATSQKTQLATYKYYFLKQLEDAKLLYEKRGKLYSKLGMLTGIFLSVLMV